MFEHHTRILLQLYLIYISLLILSQSFNTLQKSKDELLMMPKFLAKYIEKKMI